MSKPSVGNSRALKRRNLLRAGLSIAATVASARVAQACHTYRSPIDGKSGCGAYRRDGAGAPSTPASAGDLPAAPSCTPSRPTSTGARGAVRVVNRQVLTDSNFPLQGCHGNYRSTVGYDIGWWNNLKGRYRLNCVRLDTRVTWPPSSNSTSDMLDIGDVMSRVDRYVENAGRAGMYIIVDHHTSCCGYYNQELVTRFWQEAASRYRNETHVLYELQNEPTKWPHVGNPGSFFDHQLDTYRLIRSRAPARHVILLSFEKSANGLVNEASRLSGIDWSNASVGVHPYRHRSYDPGFRHVSACNARFPMILTEFNGTDVKFRNDTDDREIWSYCSARRMSWVRLELRANGGNYGDGATRSNEWPLVWSADPAS